MRTRAFTCTSLLPNESGAWQATAQCSHTLRVLSSVCMRGTYTSCAHYVEEQPQLG